jgi:predicted  nucleic acid-binding Zn-ribbon protein
MGRASARGASRAASLGSEFGESAILRALAKPHATSGVGSAADASAFSLFVACRAQVTAERGECKGPRIRLPRAVPVGYQVAPLWIAFARTKKCAGCRTACGEAAAGPSVRRTARPLRPSPPTPTVFRRSRRVADRAGQRSMQGFRMMKPANRGAAKVSVVWTIGVMMAFLVAVVMFFLTSQQSTANLQRADKAEKAAKDLQKQLEDEKKGYLDLSTVVGYYDESAAAPKTELATINEGMKSLRAAFPDIDPSIKNFQKAMPVVINAVNNQKAKVAQLETQLAGLRSENEALNKSVREIGEKNAADQRELQRKLSDLEQSRSDMQADLERQLAEARDNYKNADTNMRKAQTSIDENQRKFQQEAQGLRGKLAEQSRKLNPFTKQPETADGKVLGISTELNLGWINLGAKNRLPVGTRFRVVSGAHNENQVKAWAEVTDVQNDMAEVHFTDLKDPFDPPVVGDLLYNPLYDPVGERHAILVGRFSGAMSDKDLRALLANMGVVVQKTLDKTTDFMIVGSELYTDDNGQPLAAPTPPSDLPVYKDAIAEGVQVVQLKDLRQYVRY